MSTITVRCNACGNTAEESLQRFASFNKPRCAACKSHDLDLVTTAAESEPCSQCRSNDMCPECGANITPHDGGEPGRHDIGCSHASPGVEKAYREGSRTAAYSAPGYYILRGRAPYAGPYATITLAQDSIRPGDDGIEYLDDPRVDGRGDMKPFLDPEGYQGAPRLIPAPLEVQRLSRRRTAAGDDLHECDTCGEPIYKDHGDWTHSDPTRDREHYPEPKTAGRRTSDRGTLGEHPDEEHVVLLPGDPPKPVYRASSWGECAAWVNKHGHGDRAHIVPASSPMVKETRKKYQALQSRERKIAGLVAGIRATNPSLSEEQARHVAISTLGHQKTSNWSTGHNMPGYSPDPDSVWITDDWESARSSLLEDLDRAADQMSMGPDLPDEIFDAYNEAIEEVKAATSGEPIYVTVPTSDSEHDLGEAYWLSETDEEPEEDEF